MVTGMFAAWALVLALQDAPVSAEAAATAPPAPKSEILGRWAGRSTCTNAKGTEYCKDESVVYEFIDVPTQPATVAMRASRIVDDAELRMYQLYFTYRPDTHEWSSEFTRPSFRGVWAYAVHGDEMTGTAKVLPDGTVVRNVSVKRAPKEQARAQ